MREDSDYPTSDGSSPEAFFLQQLETIDRAIRYTCRRAALGDDDAEDFASYVKLKLIEKDYAVLQKYERRASFAAFIGVVVQRFLLDYRIGHWGKWHASAEAKRLGEAAVTIEAMLYRDGRTIDEVVPTLLRRWPVLTRKDIDGIVHRLPSRTPRTRLVDLEAARNALATLASDCAGLADSEQQSLALRIAATVRETMSELSSQDRLIFRLHFEGGMSVAAISRMLKVEQKPLYRRVQRGLTLLRERLLLAGVTAVDVEDVLSSRGTVLDFSLGDAGGADPGANDEGGP